MIDDKSCVFQEQKIDSDKNSRFSYLWKQFTKPFFYVIRVQTPDEFESLLIDFVTIFVILIDLFLIPLTLSFVEVSSNPNLSKLTLLIIKYKKNKNIFNSYMIEQLF